MGRFRCLCDPRAFVVIHGVSGVLLRAQALLRGEMCGWIETAFRAFDFRAPGWVNLDLPFPPADFCAMVGRSPP